MDACNEFLLTCPCCHTGGLLKVHNQKKVNSGFQGPYMEVTAGPFFVRQVGRCGPEVFCMSCRHTFVLPGMSSEQVR